MILCVQVPQIWDPELARVIEGDRDKSKNGSFIFNVFNNYSVICSVIKINKNTG